MAEEVCDGFDHTAHEQEVAERWGREAYARSGRWWGGLSEAERVRFRGVHDAIARDYGRAVAAGLEAGGEEAQDIARRHCAWLSVTVETTRAYVTGHGEMYVADPRFRRNYDRYGDGTAVFVRDALTIYAQHRLSD
ncbi:hypothetical protein JOC24_001516 [Streptomyces sp. HB132]|nr:hypothetical protein [Streptomyces sp. HB132]